MKIRLVFLDWQRTGRSVNPIEEALTFSLPCRAAPVSAEVSADDYADLRAAWRLGITPVFAILPHGNPEEPTE